MINVELIPEIVTLFLRFDSEIISEQKFFINSFFIMLHPKVGCNNIYILWYSSIHMKVKLIVYEMKKLTPSNKTQVGKLLSGFVDLSNHSKYKYRKEGILEKIPHFKFPKGAIILKEPITIWTLLGALFVIVGVVGVFRDRYAGKAS